MAEKDSFSVYILVLTAVLRIFWVFFYLQQPKQVYAAILPKIKVDYVKSTEKYQADKIRYVIMKMSC